MYHLSDENREKKVSNVDMRCVVEARLEGRQPVVVTHHAATLDQAVDGTADKLQRLIESGSENSRENAWYVVTNSTAVSNGADGGWWGLKTLGLRLTRSCSPAGPSGIRQRRRR